MFAPSKKFAVLALAAMFALPAAGFAADDPVVAKVNGQEIKRSDLMREMAGLPPQIQAMPLEQIYPQLLERMVDTRLLVEQGKKDKVDESADYKDRLNKAGERIMADMVLRAKVKPMVTDEKVKAAYDEVIAKQKPEEEVRARHILVKDEATAKDIIAQLGKGGDFAKLAGEKSIDKGSATQGGDLGYFTRSAMVPEFAQAAFAMKSGEVSKTPVKTEFGYHVIKVEDKRAGKPVPLDKVKPQIEAQLGEKMAADYVESLKKANKVEKFTLDGKPMVDDAAITAPAAAPAPAKEPAKK